MFDQQTYQLHLEEKRKRSTLLEPISPQPNFIQKLFPGFIAAAAPSPFISNYLGIDVSFYQPKVDYAFLNKYIHFVMPKVCEIMEEADPKYWSDAMFSTHAQNIYNAHLMDIPYLFQNPFSVFSRESRPPGSGVGLQSMKDLKPEEDDEWIYFLTGMKFKDPDGYMVDLERFWQKYGQYLDYLAGKIPITGVEVISPEWIIGDLNRIVRRIFWGMDQKLLKKAPVIIYTATWFCEAYMWVTQGGKRYNLFYDWAAGMVKEGFDILLNAAQYNVLSGVYTWETLRSGQLPMKAFPSLGFPDAYFGQISGGSAKIPNGQYGNYGFDIDLCLKKPEYYDKEFGFFDIPVVPPTPVVCETGFHEDPVTHLCVSDAIPPVPTTDELARLANVEDYLASFSPAVKQYLANVAGIPDFKRLV